MDELKASIQEDIKTSVQNFDSSIERQSEDFGNLMSEIKVSLKELKDSFTETLATASKDTTTHLDTVVSKIDEISIKLDEIGFEHLVEDANQKVLKSLELVNKNVNSLDVKASLADNFELVNQKLDVLAMEDNSLVEAELEEIKDSIYAQSQLIENLKGLENIEKIANVEAVQSEIKDVLAKFDAKLKVLAEEMPKDDSDAKLLKNELISVKKELVDTLINVFDQISFIVEAEDIKDFVDEKSEEIKSTIGDNISGVISGLDSLVDKTNSVDTTCKDIKQDIKDVKKHLNKMQNIAEDDADYSYTLQDVETDIAKLRMILDDISKAKSDSASGVIEGDFSGLAEDIMSLSTRTNKLLLSSDESYNEVKENLTEFKDVVYRLHDSLEQLDTRASSNRIEKKIDNINKLTMSCINSDKTFNQAFMYLAEWVDTASENLNSIEDKLDKISNVDEIKDIVSDVKQSIPSISEVEVSLDVVSRQLDKQQEKIDSLEAKLDTVLNLLVENNAESGTALEKKVDSIEKQIKKMGKSVDVLASYVD